MACAFVTPRLDTQPSCAQSDTFTIARPRGSSTDRLTPGLATLPGVWGQLDGDADAELGVCPRVPVLQCEGV